MKEFLEKIFISFSFRISKIPKTTIVYFILSVIVFIGILIRISGINKLDGLWYDELLTFSLAKQTFPFGIIEAVTKNEFQGILHYLYLGLWMILFGNTDLSLRLSSCVFGVLLIPAVYFLGNELTNEKKDTYLEISVSYGQELSSKGFGLFAALFVSLNPVLIYYSQEVRPYSLLALLGVLSFLFLLRINRLGGFLNYLLFAVSNILILYTYTIGFIFVFLQAFFFFIYLTFLSKKSIKNFILTEFAIFILFLPYVFSVINNFSYYFNSSFIEPFFYSKINSFSLLITLQDWFTPFLMGIYQHNDHLYRKIFLNSGTIPFLFFVFILSMIGIFLFGLFKSLTYLKYKNKIIVSDGLFLNYLIFLPCVIFLFFEVIAALSGNFCLVTRHTLLVFPLILLLCCLGLYKIKNKKVLILLVTMLLSVYLIDFVSDNSVAKEKRAGIIPAIEFLNKYNLKTNDIVLTPSLSEFIKRYLPRVNTFDIDYMKAVFLDKSKKSLKKLISDQELIDKTNKNNSHTTLKNYLLRKKPSKVLTNLISSKISGLKKGDYFVIIRKTNFSTFEEKELNEIIKNSKKYNNTAMFRLFTSKIVNDTVKICREHLILVEKKDIKPIWRVYVFKKEN